MLNINNKKIIITGGAGFIGRNILESFQGKYDFLAPTKEELDLTEGDSVFRYLEKNKPDLVIHAALSPSNILAGNLQIFFNLIRAKRFYNKMISFGSGAEYNRKLNLSKVKEEDFGQSIPSDEYGLYKYICSNYLEKNEDRDIICLRLFGIYGKYEDYRFKFISNAIVKNLLKRDIIIYQNVVFDYLFIDDLMPILDYFILNKPKFKSYNIVPDESIDLIKICNIINEISDYKSKIIVLKDGLNNEYTADNSRLKKEVSNLKFTGYKEGIERLFKYYQENVEKIDKNAIIEDKYLDITKLKNK